MNWFGIRDHGIRKLAGEVGISPAALTLWLKGRRGMPLPKVERIAAKLGARLTVKITLAVS